MPSLIINAANRAKLLLPKLANVRQTLIQNIDILFSSVILLGIGPRLQLIIDASLSQRRSTGAAAALLAILRLIFPLLWKNRNKSI